MCETNETLKISHEDHLDGIVNRVYESWGTSQIVDSWMEKYPRWAHLGRKIFRDAARVSNPRSNKFSTEYRKIYERTLAHYREERRALLEATASKASSAISQIVESVRSNVPNVPIENAHDLLHLSRVINPLKDIVLKASQEIDHDHSNSHARNTNRDAVDRLLRYKDLADELTEDE
jgi:dihydroneopterin aldolase